MNVIEYSKSNEELFKINPKSIKLLNNLVSDSYIDYILDNTFDIFNSINDILYLIYRNEHNSIILFNLNNNQKINEIKEAHIFSITNFKHYTDIYNKRDLIISISAEDNNLKLWNLYNFECLINLQNINQSGRLLSVNFLNDNNQIYFLTSNYNWKENNEKIKVYDLKGNKIKEINDIDEPNKRICFIDSYYDNNLSKNYILIGNYNYVKSYDYNKNVLYYKYCDNDYRDHYSVVINNDKNIVKLIESSCDGNIRIWNFHSGDLLNKIKVCNEWICGICLWNNEYLFVCCKDKNIKLIELNKGIIIQELMNHNYGVLTIKKIFIPKYGHCLLSQGRFNDQIKLWIIQK